jgi:glycosyltransferase involved in cell wall biosynthesis
MADKSINARTRVLNREDAPKARVAVFSLAYFPFASGAEIAVKEIMDRVGSVMPVIFTLKFDSRWKSEEIIGSARVLRLGRGKKTNDYYGSPFKKLWYIWAAWRAAEQEHKQEPFRLIWGIMASYGGLAALMFKMRHPKIPFLLTLQEGDSESHILRQVGVFYRLWRKIFSKADHVQVISSYLADFAARHGATAPVTVVPNGVDLSLISRGATLKSRKKSEVVLITTSRLVKKNGVDIILRGLAELRNSGAKDIRLEVVGSGPEEKALKSLAKELKLGDAVDFVGGVSPERIPLYLRGADIFVRPSRSEGLGNSFLEAMAAGLPIIGTRVGGIPDFLKDPNIVGPAKATGIFVKPDSPKDLALKIALLIRNDELRRQMVANARALVFKNYSWETVAARMRTIFATLLK